MIDTSEYYGGTYPEPNELIAEDPFDWDQDDYDDYDLYMADVMHEETMLS